MISKALLLQLIAFGAVGLLATLLHYVIALLTLDFFNINAYWSNLLGYCVAVFVSFFGHSRLTFQIKMSHSTFMKFVIVSIITFCASQLILFFLIGHLNLSEKLALFIMVLTIPLISFLINKLWVFTKSSDCTQ